MGVFGIMSNNQRRNMATKIPSQVQQEVLNLVDEFNKKQDTEFQITFRGMFAYLSKEGQNLFGDIIQTKLGRLKYAGSMSEWTFAVFKYSRETYDENEFLFPGSANLDGTIEGALKTGLELYN